MLTVSYICILFSLRSCLTIISIPIEKSLLQQEGDGGKRTLAVLRHDQRHRMLSLQQILWKDVCRADRFARTWRLIFCDLRLVVQETIEEWALWTSVPIYTKGGLLSWGAWPCQEVWGSCASACLLSFCTQNGKPQSSSSAFALPHASVTDGLPIHKNKCQHFRKHLKLL